MGTGSVQKSSSPPTNTAPTESRPKTEPSKTKTASGTKASSAGGAAAKKPTVYEGDGYEATSSDGRSSPRYPVTAGDPFATEAAGAGDAPPADGPTEGEVRNYISGIASGVPDSLASPEVKAEVTQNLQTIDERLVAGEIEPDLAFDLAKQQSGHIDRSAQAQSREQIARAEEIENMTPLQRVHEAAIGAGTGALKIGKSIVDVAENINHINPITAAADVVTDTVIGTAQTGDLKGSFDAAVSKQGQEISQVAENAVNVGRGVVQLAADVGEVATAPTDIVADGLVQSAVTGDVAGSFENAVNEHLPDLKESGGRLLNVAGQMTGVNNLLSGDPRKIGEGTFELAMTLGPMASKAPGGSAGVADDVVRNNIVPYNRRPPAAGVALKPTPATNPPAGLAMLDDSRTATLTKPATTVAPPTVRSPGGGGGVPSVGGNKPPVGPTIAGYRFLDESNDYTPDKNSVEHLEKKFQDTNDFKRDPDFVTHDRRHALLGAKTDRRGEALVNGAENSFYKDIKNKGLGRKGSDGIPLEIDPKRDTFFDPKNLQRQLADFRKAVADQFSGKRDTTLGMLDGDAPLSAKRKSIFEQMKADGIHNPSDKNFEQLQKDLDMVWNDSKAQVEAHPDVQRALEQATDGKIPESVFDEIYESTLAETYKDNATKFIEQAYQPPGNAELLQRFKSNIAHLKTLYDKNSFTVDQLFNDPDISSQITRATGKEVSDTMTMLDPYFRELK